MIFNLPIADIQHKDTLFEDDFSNNVAGWETIEDEDEKARIENKHYFMENKTESRWMFYHKELQNDFPKNFKAITVKKETGENKDEIFKKIFTFFYYIYYSIYKYN